MGQMTKVRGRATKIEKDENTTRVIYHDTCVVKFDDKKVRLDSGGWKTVTTKARMNQASYEFKLGYRVFQKNWEWFVELPNGKIVSFIDDMEFDRGEE